MALFLWLLLWGGYNSGFWIFRDPNFPTSTWNLIHGVRALFPLLAGWLGILVILSRSTLSLSVLEGPLGLMIPFTLFGAISSVFLSGDPPFALYWAAMFGSVLAVTFAALASENPVESLSWVHNLNCVVCAAIMFGVLASIPYLRDQAGQPVGSAPFQPRPGLFATRDIVGMPGTRNTGLARYAAVVGLAAMARLWRPKTDNWKRFPWLALLCVSLYTLYKANGRAAIAGFLVGAWVILWSQRARRAIMIAAAAVGAALLYLVGFYSAFWRYYTRGGEFDPTLSGRTITWQQGWELFLQSPWVGLGFQADRIFLDLHHMHDGLLQALTQAGLLGTIPWLVALVLAWVLVFRLIERPVSTASLALPADVPGILAFLTVSSITESNFAFYSAAWLIGAPLLGYVQCLAWQRRVFRSPAKAARQVRPRFAQPEPAARGPGGNQLRPQMNADQRK
jgi:O-antigen ligase